MTTDCYDAFIEASVQKAKSSKSSDGSSSSSSDPWHVWRSDVGGMQSDIRSNPLRSWIYLLEKSTVLSDPSVGSSVYVAMRIDVWKLFCISFCDISLSSPLVVSSQEDIGLVKQLAALVLRCVADIKIKSAVFKLYDKVSITMCCSCTKNTFKSPTYMHKHVVSVHPRIFVYLMVVCAGSAILDSHVSSVLIKECYKASCVETINPLLVDTVWRDVYQLLGQEERKGDDELLLQLGDVMTSMWGAIFSPSAVAGVDVDVRDVLEPTANLVLEDPPSPINGDDTASILEKLIDEGARDSNLLVMDDLDLEAAAACLGGDANIVSAAAADVTAPSSSSDVDPCSLPQVPAAAVLPSPRKPTPVRVDEKKKITRGRVATKQAKKEAPVKQMRKRKTVTTASSSASTSSPSPSSSRAPKRGIREQALSMFQNIREKSCQVTLNKTMVNSWYGSFKPPNLNTKVSGHLGHDVVRTKARESIARVFQCVPKETTAALDQIITFLSEAGSVESRDKMDAWSGKTSTTSTDAVEDVLAPGSVLWMSSDYMHVEDVHDGDYPLCDEDVAFVTRFEREKKSSSRRVAKGRCRASATASASSKAGGGGGTSTDVTTPVLAGLREVWRLIHNTNRFKFSPKQKDNIFIFFTIHHVVKNLEEHIFNTYADEMVVDVSGVWNEHAIRSLSAVLCKYLTTIVVGDLSYVISCNLSPSVRSKTSQVGVLPTLCGKLLSLSRSLLDVVGDWIEGRAAPSSEDQLWRGSVKTRLSTVSMCAIAHSFGVQMVDAEAKRTIQTAIGSGQHTGRCIAVIRMALESILDEILAQYFLSPVRKSALKGCNATDVDVIFSSLMSHSTRQLVRTTTGWNIEAHTVSNILSANKVCRRACLVALQYADADLERLLIVAKKEVGDHFVTSDNCAALATRMCDRILTSGLLGLMETDEDEEDTGVGGEDGRNPTGSYRLLFNLVCGVDAKMCTRLTQLMSFLLEKVLVVIARTCVASNADSPRDDLETFFSHLEEYEPRDAVESLLWGRLKAVLCHVRGDPHELMHTPTFNSSLSCIPRPSESERGRKKRRRNSSSSSSSRSSHKSRSKSRQSSSSSSSSSEDLDDDDDDRGSSSLSKRQRLRSRSSSASSAASSNVDCEKKE